MRGIFNRDVEDSSISKDFPRLAKRAKILYATDDIPLLEINKDGLDGLDKDCYISAQVMSL